MKHKFAPYFFSRSGVIFLIIFPFLCSFSLYAQDMTGTNFWLTFGQNADYSHRGVDLQVRIVAQNFDVKGTLYFTNLGTFVPFSVAAGQLYTYSLTPSEREASYQDVTDYDLLTLHSFAITNNRSIRIMTDAPISVYAFNNGVGGSTGVGSGGASCDATNVLPETALGTDYYQISWYPDGIGPSETGDAYAVIAIQDNTTIRRNNSVVATLNEGEVYYHFNQLDMTGQHITSNKPVAFFALNHMADIPLGKKSADHFFQQLAPINKWGKNYFVPVWHIVGPNYVRIMAKQDNTKIVQTGAQVVDGNLTRNTGQFVTLKIPIGSEGCYIQADKPIAVCAYFVGYESTLPWNADPSQAWIPCMEQLAKSALMAPFVPNESGAIGKIDAHYAMICTPTITREATRMQIGNGVEQNLTGGVWIENMAADFSYYIMPLIHNTLTYRFNNPAGLFTMAYGIGFALSYYYPAFSSMRDMGVAFYVNDIHYTDLDAKIICAQPVQFRAEVEEPMSSITGYLKWYIDDEEEIAARDKMVWSKELPNGTYRIKMVVILEDMSSRIAQAILTVGVPELSFKDIILCHNETTTPISFSGTYIEASACSWEVTKGLGAGIGINAENGTGSIPSFTTVNNGSLPVSVEITVIPRTAEGCEGKPTTFTITVYARPEVNLGNDTTLCWLDSLKLNAVHPVATHYHWQDNSTGNSYTVYYEGGEYWVTLSSACGEASDTINVSYLNIIELDLGKDTTFCRDNVHLPLDVTSPYASYLWQDGSKSPVYIIEEPGIYSVTVSNACISAADTIEITIKDCELNIIIPNIFTPNGDGVNDIFGPELTPLENIKEFQMFIYDRWGRIVFSTESYDTLWNGYNKNGHPHAEGVYYCVIYVTNMLGQEHRYHASVMLKR